MIMGRPHNNRFKYITHKPDLGLYMVRFRGEYCGSFSDEMEALLLSYEIQREYHIMQTEKFNKKVNELKSEMFKFNQSKAG